MSKDIENKVVSMIFDNSEFEKPAEQTMSTIDKLKKALNFKGVTDGFDAMQKGIKAVTFSPIEKGIDSVYAKFTFLERFTIQLYDRLANKIISTGHMITSEMFTRPISTGKSEYEEKMSAVQTIMASSKKSLEEVNSVLAELNKYADDTIYSFGDMTTNIGKFTNAGVDLKDAVAAIKGISNEAALSGANANEASRAMYNFAQALSSGSVKLIDWKSIENANMATKEFKQELIDTAVAVGKLTKGADGFYRTTQGKSFNATAKFNDALQDQWMTSEVLIKTLKKYSDTSTDVGRRASAAATEVKTFSMLVDTLKEALQSGWSETWEAVIGDFEQAKRLWTDVSAVLGGLVDRMSSARNTMIKFWAQFGGRTSLLKSISNLWKSLTNVLGAVRDAFRSLVPAMTGRRLIDITRRFERFTDSLVPSIDTVNKIRNVFIGFFNLLGIGVDAVKAFTNAFMPLVKSVFKYFTTGILKSANGFKEWSKTLRSAIKEAQIFERLFGGIADVLSYIGKILKELISAIGRILNEFKAGGFKAGFIAIGKEISNVLKNAIDIFRSTDPLGKLKSLGKDLANVILRWPVASAFADLLKAVYLTLKNNPITGLIVDIFEGLFNTIQTILNKFSSINTSGVKKGNEKIAKEFSFFTSLKNFLYAIFSGIAEVFSRFAPTLWRLGKSLASVIKSVFSSILSILKNSDLGDVGGFLAGGGIGALTYNLSELIKNIRKKKTSIQTIMKNFSTILQNAGEAIASFSKLAKAKALKEIAVALAILAGSLLVISSIPKDKMADSMAAILELFAGLALTMNVLSKSKNDLTGSVSMLSISTVLLSLAASVAALSVAMAVLSFISYDDAVKGIFVISSLFAVLASTIKKIDASPKVVFSAVPILAMAAFIAAVSLALVPLAIISSFNENAIITSVLAVSAIVLVMSLACKAIATSSKIGNVVSAVPIISMAALIVSVSLALVPLAIMGTISEEAVKTAMLSLIGVLSAVTLCIYAISKASGIKSVFSAAPILAMVTIILSVSAALFLLTLAAKIDASGLALAMNALAITIIAVSGVYVLISRTASGLSLLRVAPFIFMTSSLIAVAASLALLTAVMNSRASGAEAAIESLVKCIGLLTAVYLAISNFGSAKVLLRLAPILVLVNMLVLVAGALAALTIATHGREDGAMTAVVALTGVFAAIAGMAFVISKIKIPSLYSIAKLATMAITITALMLPFVAMITAIGSMFSAAEDEGSGDVITMLGRFGIVLVSLMVVPILFKKLSDKWGTITALKLIGIGAALKSVVSAVAIAASAMKELTVAQIGKFLLLATGVAAIGAILSAVNGIRLVANGAKMFALVVVSVTASIWLFTKALQSLSNASFDFDNLKRNIRGISASLVECREDLAMGLAAIVSGIIEGVLASIYNSLETALTQTLDMLIKVAPEAFNKIASLFIILAKVIEERAPELARALVRAVTSIIKSIGAAIKEHSTEIVMAIDGVIDAILGLVVKAFGRLIGITKEGLDDFASGIVPMIRPIANVLIGIFAVDKLITAASKAASAIGNFCRFVKDSFKELAAAVSAHPIAAALIGVSIVAKKVIDSMADSITAVTENDKKAAKTANEMLQREQEYQDKLRERQSAMKAADSEYDTIRNASEELSKIVDTNGKIKEGYESRFNLLRETLSKVVTLNLEEDGTITILDKQNQKYEYRKTLLDDIIKKEALQAKLEAAKSTYSEALEKDNTFAENVANAKKEYNDFLKEQVSYDFSDKAQSQLSQYRNDQLLDQYEKFVKRANEIGDGVVAARELGIIDKTVSRSDAIDILNEFESAARDVEARKQVMSLNVVSVEESWAKNKAFIENYENAYKAIADNAEDAEEKVDALFRNDYTVSSLGAFSEEGRGRAAIESQLHGMIDEYKEKLKLFKDASMEIPEEVQKQYRLGIDSLAKTAAELGSNTGEILGNSGLSDWDSYYSGFTKNISKDMDKAGDYVGEGFEQSVKKLEPTWTRLSEHMADSFHSRFAKRLGIESPSKVFAKLGMYTVLGLIEGVESEIPNLEDASRAMAVASLSAYNSVANSEASTFAWAPLIDTTGIQNGTAAIQGQLTSLQNNPLTASMTSKLAASVDTSSLEMDNTRILNSMTYIQEEISTLKDTMANLQVVMDSGLLVGALAPGMDMELGRRTVRKERGV